VLNRDSEPVSCGIVTNNLQYLLNGARYDVSNDVKWETEIRILACTYRNVFEKLTVGN